MDERRCPRGGTWAKARVSEISQERAGAPLPTLLPVATAVLRPRALARNLQLRQERNQRMRTHLHHRRKVELDQRLALLGRQLEFVGETARIGEVLRAQLGVVSKPVQRRSELDQLRLDRGIVRGALSLALAAGPAQRCIIVMPARI